MLSHVVTLKITMHATTCTQATYDCWVRAMEFCEPGRPYKEIGGVIEAFVQQQGYTSVKVRNSFCVCKWPFFDCVCACVCLFVWAVFLCTSRERNHRQSS